MTEISLELSDEVLSSSIDEPETLSRAILTAAAVKLYQNRKLSSGKAAQLAGLSRIEFFEKLSRADVPLYDPSPEELTAELKTL
jgi:predicted HTH domain antitoxin